MGKSLCRTLYFDEYDHIFRFITFFEGYLQKRKKKTFKLSKRSYKKSNKNETCDHTYSTRLDRGQSCGL